jgi:uncharacterized membrane protein YgcG
MTSIPAASFRVVCAVAVLNRNGTVKDWLVQIVAGGTVTLDATAENLRTCSFSCLDPTGVLTPLDDGTGILQVDGVEIKIYMGYIVDGNVTLYPQGIFQLGECDTVSGSTDTGPGPVLNITGTDRSIRISAALFDDAFAIGAGVSVDQAIRDILEVQAPWCTQTSIEGIAQSSVIAAQAYQPGDDPWEAIQEIAASAGMLAFFDVEGVLRVIEDPSKAPKKPAALFIDGNSSTYTSITRIESNSPGYNGVIVTGQSLSASSAVISGSAYDSDPKSRTYFLGPYGKVPAPPVQVSTVTDSTQASAMAKALLPQVLGLTKQCVIDTVPCFWLDAYDLFYAADFATQTKGTYILEQATIPMDFSQLEALTGVPLGSPIGQFDGLSDTPSVAEYAPTSTGAFNYNPTTGTYTYGSGSGGGGGFGGGGFGGAGFGLGAGVFSIFNAAQILRDGNGLFHVATNRDGIDTVVRDAE